MILSNKSQEEIEQFLQDNKEVICHYIQSMLNSGLATCFYDYKVWCAGLAYFDKQCNSWYSLYGGTSVNNVLDCLTCVLYASDNGYNYTDFIQRSSNAVYVDKPSYLSKFTEYLHKNWIYAGDSTNANYQAFLSSVFVRIGLMQQMLFLKSLIHSFSKSW